MPLRLIDNRVLVGGTINLAKLSYLFVLSDISSSISDESSKKRKTDDFIISPINSHIKQPLLSTDDMAFVNNQTKITYYKHGNEDNLEIPDSVLK